MASVNPLSFSVTPKIQALLLLWKMVIEIRTLATIFTNA